MRDEHGRLEVERDAGVVEGRAEGGRDVDLPQIPLDGLKEVVSIFSIKYKIVQFQLDITGRPISW